MQPIKSGNFNNEYQDYKGWILGHFVDQESPFYNKDFEIKWGKHKKGVYKDFSINKQAKTLAILIYGKMLYTFPNNKTVLLENQGDYVYWDKEVPHKRESVEDCLTLTIRWPSIPNDQS